MQMSLFCVGNHRSGYKQVWVMKKFGGKKESEDEWR